MKRLAMTLILIVTASLCFSQSQLTVTETFRSFYPRLEGTSGEEKAVRFILERLTELNIAHERYGFEEFSVGHSFSTIIEAHIPGNSKDTILVTAPLNHPRSAEKRRDGSLNCAALLHIAEELVKRKPPVNVTLLFLGAEYGSGEQYPLGTKRFLQSYYPEAETALIYLAGVAGRPFHVRTGGDGSVTPRWLVERSWNALHTVALPFTISLTETQIFRAGLADSRPEIASYLEAGIPSVQLDARSAGDPERNETVQAVTAHALSDVVAEMIYVEESVVPSTWDSHYLFFPLPDRLIVVSERTYVLTLLAVIAVTLIYGLAFRYRFDRYVLTVRRNLWNLPALFAVAFGLSTFATVLIRHYVFLRAFPTLWQHNPLLFFAGKVALSVFLFAIIFQWLRQLPFSQNGSFYSAAAIFLLFLALIALAAANISFSFYFVWAFLCAFLFSTSRVRWLKSLLLLAGMIPLLWTSYEIFAAPALRTARALLLSPVNGNLVVALVVLPFLLMIIRMDFLIKHPVTGGRRFAMKVVVVVMGISVAGILGYVQFTSPYGPDSPQPVEAVQETDMRNNSSILRLSSPAPLTGLSFEYAQRTITVDEQTRSHTIDVETPKRVWDVSVQRHDFLSRSQWTVRIEGARRPVQLKARLRTSGELIVFDSSFPYTVDTFTNTVRFSIGQFPPNPLELHFTLPREASGILELEGRFSGLAQQTGLVSRRFELERTHVVHDSLPIGTTGGYTR